MTLEDLRILGARHDRAARNVVAIATNIAEAVADGGELPEEMRQAYIRARAECIAAKGDLAKALEDEFEDAIYG